MPPKPKYTREEIVTAAFEIAKESGIDSVVARAVGNRLGTSATPIFTVFDSMEQLKEEVLFKAQDAFSAYMDGIFDFDPVFKEFGIRWVRFSIEQPRLYRLLFQRRGTVQNPYELFQLEFRDLLGKLIPDVAQTFGIDRMDAENLFSQMLIYANGLSCFYMDGEGGIGREEISGLISQVCIGLVLILKMRNGTFTEPMARAMADEKTAGCLPRKKENP